MPDRSKKFKLPKGTTVNLIDVSGIVYSRYYGMKNMHYNGFPTGAIFGFCNIIIELMDKFKNSVMIAAFDSSRHTFRSEIYSDYKAHRKKTPEELRVQWPHIVEACEHFGIHIERHAGFEADDIIASYVEQMQDNNINIISHDKDLMQLLVKPNVRYYNHSSRIFIDRHYVEHKYLVPLQYFLDYLALMGDSSDNVSGIDGVGPKTAAELVNRFGTVENLASNLDQLPNSKKYLNVKNNIDSAILAKKLITLHNSVMVETNVTNSPPKQYREFFEKFGLFGLIRKMASVSVSRSIINTPDIDV